jgi:hypothetical protein
MTIALSKLPLSILRIEYETLLVRSKQSRLTSNIATSAVPNIDERMKSDAWA